MQWDEEGGALVTLVWAPVPSGEELSTWLHRGQQKGAVNELLNSLHESFPSVRGKGIPVHQFETFPCKGSRHNGF